MAKQTGYWGIDIGESALKAIRLELIDGQPTATAFDYIEHPKILSQPDADRDALTREALEKFLSRNPLKKDEVAVGIAGASGLARFVKLPPVEEKKIPEIVKFEAKQQIPFPLEEVVWDYQKIAGGESIGGFAMETEVGLFAMKREVISRFLSHFQAVRAEVHLVQMAPLALANFATYELLRKGGPGGLEGEGMPVAPGETDDTPKGKKRCAVVLDIGTDSSNLIITDGGKIIWQRPLPLGGNHFTRALTKELKLTFAKAEHLKRNAAKSPELANILRALRPVLTDFVGEVQRSLGYFTNTHRDAHVAYMVGLGNAFRLPGLQKYLAEKLSLDVRKPARVERLSGDSVLNDPNFSENVLTFPVAIGLALQGLKLARLQTNLLPNEIRVDRMIRAKKPWAAAAAAGLLLGTGALAMGYGSQYAAVTDPEIAKAMAAGKSAADAAKAQESQKSAKKSEVDTEAAAVKAIIVGNDERLNWIRLNEVLVAALPRHGDGSAEYPTGNLRDPDQAEFWSTDEGRRAFQKFLERMAAGIPLEKLFDDDKSEFLANVNVESVYARYTDNLGTFLANADTFVQADAGRAVADDLPEAEAEVDPGTMRKKPKAADGAGWVVEVRGFTYHKDATNFLRRTLVKNLRRFDQYADATAADLPVNKVIPGAADPIKGQVSYVMLLLSKEDRAPARDTFRYISGSLIDRLLQPAAPAGPSGPGAPPAAAGKPPGAPAAPGGAGAPAPAGWVPLFGGGPGAGATPLGMPGASGFPGAADPFAPPQPGVVTPTPTPVTPGSGPRPKVKPRYEFVVSFVWKEPLPSEGGGAAATAATAAPR